MPLFAFYGLDKTGSGSAIRSENRAAHVAWLKSLGETLRLAGPLLAENGEDMIGSLLVLQCEDLAAVETLLNADPYAKADLFERVEIRPYKWVLGAGAPET